MLISINLSPQTDNVTKNRIKDGSACAFVCHMLHLYRQYFRTLRHLYRLRVR